MIQWCGPFILLDTGVSTNGTPHSCVELEGLRTAPIAPGAAPDRDPRRTSRTARAHRAPARTLVPSSLMFRMFASFCSIGFRGALLVLFGAHVVQAQDHATVGAATGIGSVRGRLVDSATTRPITNGSVTIRREADTSFAGGALPGADGSFRVESLTPGRYTVRVRALGFAPTVRTGITISTDAPVADLGAIGLAPVAARITELVITADQQDVTLAPDRNSYSTKNMTTASGGTAVDVLRNVPSVEVDGSNKVSLRGNENVVVQINGSSSPLHGEQLGNFLAQLPASTIARVEVATNPSAKNDPEGTAGIINIVLEQRVELGLSGGVTASTGTTGLATLSGNIGQQRGPWTLFASYSFFRDSRTVIGHRDLTNLVLSDPAFVFAHLNASSSPLSQNLILRSEYRVDEHDVLSADAVILGGDFARKSVANYTDFNASRDVIGLFDQFNTQHSRNGLEDYAVAFRRTGRPDASTFSAELHATRANSTANVELFGLVHQADSSTSAIAGPRERDVTSAQYPLWNLQTDYTHPFGAHAKLESGLKGTLRHTTNDFTAANLDSLSGQFVLAPERTTAFDYREQIGAGYMVLSQQLGKAQTQAGLRLEQATTRLTLAGTSQPSDTRYASAFPSAIVSYNLTEMHQIKLSYSRRITRPDPFQLSPVVYREDARHSFLGNPNLRPEYTDAFELTFQENKGWGSVQINPYVRHTAQPCASSSVSTRRAS